MSVMPIPANVEAERALLGALLVNNAMLEEVRDQVQPEAFYVPVHARIYDAICAHLDQGKRASPITIKAFFESDPALADVGGADYVMRLANDVVSPIGAPDYAEAVVYAFGRRQLVDACSRVSARASMPAMGDTVESLTQEIAGAIDKMQATRGGGFVALSDAVARAEHDVETTQKAGGVVGVRTGLIDLDRQIGGFEKGSFIILAGRSSMGKSALGQHLAMYAADHGSNVAFFSLEMRDTHIAERELSKRTEIPLDRLRRGQLSDTDWMAIKSSMKGQSLDHLWIESTSGLSVSSLRDRARKLARRVGGLGLVVVDYLQLVRPDDRYRGNKVAEVAEISGALKGLAKDLEVPVIALAQLNREVEGRDEKRPRLSDLRWSGDLEQDADLVMLLYRSHYYQREAPKDPRDFEQWQQDRNVLEIIVAKQRQGATGTVRVGYDTATSRFWNLG